ncbi:probable myosin light chain kinase DDB_G0279831 [Anastrepha ludens]|uniref:probable myosin light chain kinase DDB_G0279831 n=1 Tax=Anastrepha ludens TaxID=28586 RepID=UPI0023B0DDDB|nr:probable myosin light chain kinase DDB_G0279831 [Anastrepha ludens]
MFANFRILLTLLVFVNVYVQILSAIETEEAISNTNLSLPLEFENEEVETKTTTDAVITTMAGRTEVSKARSIADNNENEVHKFVQKQLAEMSTAHSKESVRPLKNVFRGIYKSYKSTYMGNGTSAEYKKKLIQRLSSSANTSNPMTANNEEVTLENKRAKQQTSLTAIIEPAPIPPPALESQALKVKLKEKIRKRKRKYHRSNSSAKRAKTNTHLNNSNIVADKTNESNNTHNNNNNCDDRHSDILLSSAHSTLDKLSDKHYRYTIGPGVNMSFDMLNDIVNVNLDGDNLREIMRGRWLNDNTEEGRGKKYDMVTKVLPLFVLPFLIQSAIVPFLVTKLKLLLVKSILIGKLAIFLLILSAIKNSNKMVQSYEVAPSYWAGEPSRRSELAAAASSTGYNGYRVEGKPAAWIN